MANISAGIDKDGSVYIYVRQGKGVDGGQILSYLCDDPSALIIELQNLEPDALAVQHEARIEYLQTQLDQVNEAKSVNLARAAARVKS